MDTGSIGTQVLSEHIVGDVNQDIEEQSNEDSDDEQAKINKILGLKDKDKLKELFSNAIEIKQFNVFNKIYTKHKENIYFFKIINDHDEMVSHIKLVKFNLLTLK